MRERYLGKDDEKREAMEAFVGSRKERSPDDVEKGAVETVRDLRRSSRLQRLSAK